jgi:hypothetical protein
LACRLPSSAIGAPVVQDTALDAKNIIAAASPRGGPARQNGARPQANLPGPLFLKLGRLTGLFNPRRHGIRENGALGAIQFRHSIPPLRFFVFSGTGRGGFLPLRFPLLSGRTFPI